MSRTRYTLKPCFDAPVAVAPHPAEWRAADVLEVISLLVAAGLAFVGLVWVL